MEESRELSVHVAVPVYGATPGICQLSFGSFIGHGVAKGFIKNIGMIEGAYIDRARNDICRQVLASKCTHVMFVDQDMILPDNCLERLLKHNAPIVGGSYFGKDDYFTPVAFNFDPFRRVYELSECEAVLSDVDLPEGIDACWCGRADPHLHKVGGTGMGCTLIEAALLSRMREHFRDEMWFSSKETGEDVHFCTRAKEMGVDTLLDGFIQCGHVRWQIVTRQHYDWARQHAPRCNYESCGRVAFWKTGEDDTVKDMHLCWEHRDMGKYEYMCTDLHSAA